MDSFNIILTSNTIYTLQNGCTSYILFILDEVSILSIFLGTMLSVHSLHSLHPRIIIFNLSHQLFFLTNNYLNFYRLCNKGARYTDPIFRRASRIFPFRYHDIGIFQLSLHTITIFHPLAIKGKIVVHEKAQGLKCLGLNLKD